jgi:RNA-directed DNA polymerase
MNEAKP